eukprot:TRINITY_DN14331_c0_g3_i1.p1 TRINITY_DN14331_c0_g3~~TRINITY_DN14331_c0_g3_i1.p1  ORF type:complete len:631 (+),score=101.36 TRINITY_DN14331_c0_g3_i1:29-1894(+)
MAVVDLPDVPRGDSAVPEIHASNVSMLLSGRIGSTPPVGPEMYVPCDARGLDDDMLGSCSTGKTQEQETHQACTIAELEPLISFMQKHFQKQEAMLERLVRWQGNSPGPVLREFEEEEETRMRAESGEKSSPWLWGNGEHESLQSEGKASDQTDEEDSDMWVPKRDRRRQMSDEDEEVAMQIARSKSASPATRSSKFSIRTGEAKIRRCPFVESSLFGNVMFTVIIANVVLVGVEVDVSAHLPYNEIPASFSILNIAFVSAFVLEISLKIAHGGCRSFFMREESRWNIFDAVVVMFAVLELVADTVISSLNLPTSDLRVFRLLRLIRIFRGIKILRVLRFVGSLRTLLHSVLTTLKSLAWTMILLMLLFYAVGVALTQAAADHCRAEAIEKTGDGNAMPQCNSEAVNMYWGNLAESMLTLFMSVTGGVSWGICLSPLREISILSVFTFLAYIVFTVLALLNVVTGVFCHSAIESASADKDIAALIQLTNQKMYAATIRSMFYEIDDDRVDGITLDELESALRDENFCAYLESIEISTSDAWTLFKLMDSDKSGNLDLEEFVSGCMSLRGPASAMQVAKLNMENGTARRSMRDLEKNVRQIQVDLWKVLRAMDKASEQRKGK